MNIEIPQEVIEKFGGERVLEILNSKVEELQNQIVAEQKRDLGEKLFAVKDSPEVQSALAKLELETGAEDAVLTK